MGKYCSICSSDTYIERAHVRARYSRDEDNTMFNLVDLCPTCHTYFDNKLITLHPDWRCWIFSDIYYKVNSYGAKFENKFRKFVYSYPPASQASKIEQLDLESIKWNNDNEFEVRGNFSSNMYFDRLERKLTHREKWEHEKQRPIHHRIQIKYESVHHEDEDNDR